jgi:hypothetical protein
MGGTEVACLGGWPCFHVGFGVAVTVLAGVLGVPEVGPGGT